MRRVSTRVVSCSATAATPPTAITWPNSADAGFVLGMDRFGLYIGGTFEARADTLIEMVRRGYTDRMVLSQDACCYIDWIDPQIAPALTQWHYTHIFEEVIPYVLERGVTKDQIDAMLVEVPRRFFEKR